MQHSICDALMERLSSQLDLSRSRLQTLALLIIGMVNARTVNLSHLASQFPGEAHVASSYRRLQRFFQHVRLAGDWSAPLVVKHLGLYGPWLVCLDRTNWKIGSRDVNILMLAVVTRRFRIPLIWTVLDKAGSSSAVERIALMERYLKLFDAASIRMLLADREFIGGRWIEFLLENNIPFAIRLKENLTVALDDGRTLSLQTLLRKPAGAGALKARAGRLCSMETQSSKLLRFAAKRIKGGELLIIATTAEPSAALNAYKKRWAIECLFGDAKTRGLNLEDTRLVIPAKLDTLLALVALAVAWAGKTASVVVGRGEISRKTHGYRAKSWFRTGFDQLRKWVLYEPPRAIQTWSKIPTGRESVV